MEDIDIDANGNIYIAETGADSANLSPSINAGGVPALHLNSQFVPSTQRYDDPYGRILKFNPSTGAISVYLEGGSGTGQNAKYTFSNPDNIALDRTRNLLFIQEDLIGNNRGRNPSYVPSAGSNWICEGYMLDLNINNPTVNNCKLFTIFPKGAEVTGGYYTPDYSTLFINVQHPSGTNPVPFNTDVTIAVTGFPPVGIKGSNSTAEKFSLNQNYPNPFNPATKITFSLPDRDFVTLKVFDELGREITVLINGVLDKGSYEVTFDGLDLPSGMYFYYIKADGHSDAKKMLLIK
jgi:secreted PhoX family phosphatase